MLILEIAAGLALGVALIPVARAIVAGLMRLPRMMLRVVLHPLVIITGVLLIDALLSSPSCRPLPPSHSLLLAPSAPLQ